MMPLTKIRGGAGGQIQQDQQTQNTNEQDQQKKTTLIQEYDFGVFDAGTQETTVKD